MSVALTVLSVLLFWIFLIVLSVGLWLIFRPLESIRTWLEKIAMGVRAIERETEPLLPQATNLIASLERVDATLGEATDRLATASRDLDTAAPALRRRL